MDMTDVAEGSIVRCITRLHETCREVKNAARIIGRPSLQKTMEEAQDCIKRSIASPYNSMVCIKWELGILKVIVIKCLLTRCHFLLVSRHCRVRYKKKGP